MSANEKIDRNDKDKDLAKVKKELSEISFAVYEATNERSAQREKRFFAVIILLIALLVATNFGWILYEMSMETVTETTVTIDNVEQQTDAADNNFYSIVGGELNGNPKSQGS